MILRPAAFLLHNLAAFVGRSARWAAGADRQALYFCGRRAYDRRDAPMMAERAARIGRG
ncbi:hypothetical protein [Sphingobium indicum]|uniref:hypothetical protein n=1 Tax=Sphingobium indicum TaxID=332055 RepID=UPI0013EC9192|nr:hypothetical protein [Sphingobium indicum]